jgi:hypothetical protein
MLPSHTCPRMYISLSEEERNVGKDAKHTLAEEESIIHRRLCRQCMILSPKKRVLYIVGFADNV